MGEVPRKSELQGEGNRDADRKYREGAQRHAESGQVEPEAREAQDALEGDEAEELKQAEKAGKARAQGPASR